MQTIVEDLTAKDKLALIKFYGTDAYLALKRLIEAERLALAKDHVDQVDILQIRYLSGQANSLKKLVGTLRNLHKQSEDNKVKSQKR